MNIRLDRAPLWAFFLLFPGFFFYHTLLGLGLMHAYLGGYFAIVSLLVLGPLLLCYAGQLRRERQRYTRADFYFLLYQLYFFCIIVVNLAAGANLTTVGNHILSLVFSANIFILFKCADFAGRAFRAMALASLCAMSAIVFCYAVDGSFYLGALGVAQDPDSVATYQGFSRSYLITFIAAIAHTRGRGQRALLYLLAATTLFVNTARSEFAATLFLIPVIELYYARNKVNLIAGILLLGLIANNYIGQLITLLPDNRTLELLDLSQSTSANLRHYLSMQAWHTIQSHPLFGDYASYVPGYYAHNILSAWVDLGILGFIALLALLIIPTIHLLLCGFFTLKKTANFTLAWSLLCTSLLLLSVSYYFTDMLIGAALGAVARYRLGTVYGHHRPSELRAPA